MMFESSLAQALERIRDLEAEIAKYKLKWQKGQPKKEGDYWLKSGRQIWIGRCYPEIPWVDKGMFWAGPILPPEEE